MKLMWEFIWIKLESIFYYYLISVENLERQLAVEPQQGGTKKKKSYQLNFLPSLTFQLQTGRAQQPARVLPAGGQRLPGPIRGRADPAPEAGKVHIEPEVATL